MPIPLKREQLFEGGQSNLIGFSKSLICFKVFGIIQHQNRSILIIGTWDLFRSGVQNCSRRTDVLHTQVTYVYSHNRLDANPADWTTSKPICFISLGQNYGILIASSADTHVFVYLDNKLSAAVMDECKSSSYPIDVENRRCLYDWKEHIIWQAWIIRVDLIQQHSTLRLLP